jgi:hypothetical protein
LHPGPCSWLAVADLVAFGRMTPAKSVKRARCSVLKLSQKDAGLTLADARGVGRLSPL